VRRKGVGYAEDSSVLTLGGAKRKNGGRVSCRGVVSPLRGERRWSLEALFSARQEARNFAVVAVNKKAVSRLGTREKFEKNHRALSGITDCRTSRLKILRSRELHLHLGLSGVLRGEYWVDFY